MKVPVETTPIPIPNLEPPRLSVELSEDLELLLREINDFNINRARRHELPKSLEDYLYYVAKTGNTVFPWTHVRSLFRWKLQDSISKFNGEALPMELSVFERFDLFRSAPFTIQRLTELLIEPKRHYKRKEKYLFALEKALYVVSTVEPSGEEEEVEEEEVNGKENGTSFGPSSYEELHSTYEVISVPVEGGGVGGVIEMNGGGGGGGGGGGVGGGFPLENVISSLQEIEYKGFVEGESGTPSTTSHQQAAPSECTTITTTTTHVVEEARITVENGGSSVLFESVGGSFSSMSTSFDTVLVPAESLPEEPLSRESEGVVEGNYEPIGDETPPTTPSLEQESSLNVSGTIEMDMETSSSQPHEEESAAQEISTQLEEVSKEEQTSVQNENMTENESLIENEPPSTETIHIIHEPKEDLVELNKKEEMTETSLTES